MKKSKVSLFLTSSALMLSGLALTSCGSESNRNVANAGEAFEMRTIQDLKNNSSKDSPLEIVFWHSFGDAIEGPLNNLIDEFEDEMASKEIYIDVKALSTGGGYDGLRSKINSGIASNNLPTMLLGYPDHFADYINSGILLPLDSYVNSTDTEIGMIGDYAYSDIIEEYQRENILDANGDGVADICGIPFNKSTEVMYYNASVVDPILQEKGWLGEDGYWENPTWDQLWTISQTLKDKVAAKNCTWTYNKASYESIKTDYPVYIDSESNFFITTSRQWCQNQDEAKSVYTTSSSVSSGEVRFDNSITRSAQNYFLEKANAGLWNLPAKKSQGYGSKLMQNLEAFISIGSTAGVKNNASPKYELKVAAVPQRSYDTNSSVQAVIQQGTNAAILNKNSNNLTRLASWLLIRYLTSTESTTTFSMDTGYMPVRNSAVESQTYQNFLQLANAEFANKPENAYEKALYGTVAQAIYAANKERSYFYTDPAFKGSSTIRDKLETLVQTIYVTGKTIDFAYEATYNQLRKQGITCISEGK